MKRTLFTALAFLAIIGCAAEERLPPELSRLTTPGKRPDLTGVRTVALFEFDNATRNPEAAGRILGKLSACLASSGRFALVERKQLRKVLEETALQLSDAVGGAGYVRAGRLVGADAVLVGEIGNFAAEATPLDYSYSRSGGDMLLPLGAGLDNRGPLGVPSEKRTYKVMRLSAGVSFSGRLIGVESGQVLWGGEASRAFALREGEYGVNSEVNLLDRLLDLAVADFCFPLNPPDGGAGAGGNGL